MTNQKLKFGILIFAIFLGLMPNTIWAQTNPNAINEDIVKFYFSDVPVMIDIAKCESGFKQYNPDGSAFHDASGTYVGIYQIAESIHTAKAQSLGFDIRNIDGNLQYARYLYNASGTNPWKGCLPKTTTPAVTPTPSPAPTTPTPTPSAQPVTPAPSTPVPSGSFTNNLRMGMTNPQVRLMQKALNQNGFVVSVSGAGSVGNETSYFGSLTREALKKFQCAKQIVCDGNEGTTGFGRVGPMTRAALNTIIFSQ